MRLVVIGSSWTSTDIKRIHFRSSELGPFATSVFTDRYVKLVFPRPGVDYPLDLDIRAMRATHRPEDLPDVRTYTALHPDVDAGTVDIDFVIHGSEGIAGPWAANAQVGDELVVNGPGGAYRPDPSADWHLLVGDESAIPAVLAAVEDIGASPNLRVVLEIEGRGREPRLTLTPGSHVTWVYRQENVNGGLLEAVRRVDWLPGRVDAFVHGEAQDVMHGIRPFLLRERGLTRSQLSISGYWRRGRTEPSFREWKREHAEDQGEGRRG